MEKQKRKPLTGFLFCVDSCWPGLFDVAILALGRPIVVLVTVLAGLMCRIFHLRCLGAVVAGATGTGIDAIMMAGGAVGNIPLVLGMVEGHRARRGFELDFSRSIVGDDIGGYSDKGDHNQYANQFFHLLSSSLSWV